MRCRQQRIEPPGRINRIVGAAVTEFEQRFCTEILARLGSHKSHRLQELIAGDADGVVRVGGGREHQEVSMLALHLLQSALVHVNTLLVQEVLADPAWAGRPTDEDRRALTPLFWTDINPCGTFGLDMNTHLNLAAATDNLAAG